MTNNLFQEISKIVLDSIPGKKRQNSSGWISFNSPCCHNRGHRADKRSRGGIIISENKWSYSCFNCGFKCGSSSGKLFSKSTRDLLEWCGLDNDEISRLSFLNYSLREDVVVPKIKKKIASEITIPGAVFLDKNNDSHSKWTNYLFSRGIDPSWYKFMITPQSDDPREIDRVIIPYYEKGILVGQKSRYFGDSKKKYWSQHAPEHLFNLDSQPEEWGVLLLVEGEFDAISIGGVAYMGNNLSDEQINIIKKTGKKIILVPDHDVSGMNVVQRAMDNNFYVSIPEWENGIKDVNDAVFKYGRLPTIMSIVQNATNNKLLIELKKRAYCSGK
jgi:hypothetical protein